MYKTNQNGTAIQLLGENKKRHISVEQNFCIKQQKHKSFETKMGEHLIEKVAFLTNVPDHLRIIFITIYAKDLIHHYEWYNVLYDCDGRKCCGDLTVFIVNLVRRIIILIV